MIEIYSLLLPNSLVEQHYYNDEVGMEIGLSLGGLLWYNVVDKGNIK